MSGGKAIAVAWLTFAILIIIFVVWTFSNMGDCPAGEICQRPQWFDLVIVGIGIAVWLAGLSLVLRRKKN